MRLEQSINHHISLVQVTHSLLFTFTGFNSALWICLDMFKIFMYMEAMQQAKWLANLEGISSSTVLFDRV